MLSVDNNNKKNDNQKRVLCVNMLNNKKCNYGNKCMYAHNLSDQKIDTVRHKVYTIIKCADDLSHINLIYDEKLYKTMLDLTKICSLCNKGLCPGGYNCRNGALNIKCRICYEDLVYGNCKRNNCQSVHLTDKKLVPYMKQKNKYLDKERSNDYNKRNNSSENLDKEYFIKYPKKINDNKNNKIKCELNNIKGILLTENFLMTHFGKHNKDYYSSDSENEEEIEKIIKYLNDDDNNSDDESIFDV